MSRATPPPDRRPFLEELGEVMSVVWHGDPDQPAAPGLAATFAEARHELTTWWRDRRNGVL